ncbi:MAG: FKBP-type peptidyl-prolyl cis-trans isomerase [Planctomycetes bacterium]|nr:FKBP-type peptidyl-prolyl cis-trans isomerase [Planctomycetota bacterium]
MAKKGGNKGNRGGSAGQNRKKGEDYLTKNAAKPGVVTTESGLQYMVVEEGNGLTPLSSSRVKVHQRIHLVGGTELDDTYKTGEPARFSIKEAIEGYAEGLMLMKVGSRYKLTIPPELAWGKKGVGSRIGPNSVLLIDAMLLAVED